MLKKLFATLAMSALLLVGATAGAGPAQAAPDKQLTFMQNPNCSKDPGECDEYLVDIKMKKTFGTRNLGIQTFTDTTVTASLNDSMDRPLKTTALLEGIEESLASDKAYRGDSYYGVMSSGTGTPLGEDRYYLRVKVQIKYEGWCSTHWGWYSGYYEYCPTVPKNETHYLTYELDWNGNKITANRLSFTASAKKSATTATTYTAKKSASHTATASYTAKEKASYRYKGKTYTATASKTTKKTHKVTKQGSYKANKLKRTAAATAKATSYHSDEDAERLAGVKATAAAKTLATNNAKAYANGQATSKAKKALTSKVKSAAYAAAKKKITAKVKADTKKYAKAAALKAAKKKAGR